MVIVCILDSILDVVIYKMTLWDHLENALDEYYI